MVGCSVVGTVFCSSGLSQACSITVPPMTRPTTVKIPTRISATLVALSREVGGCGSGYKFWVTTPTDAGLTGTLGGRRLRCAWPRSYQAQILAQLRVPDAA